MYQQHFGMTRPPFSTSPDPGRYFPTAGHEAALAEIRTAIDDGEAIGILEADPGLGKTLLAHVLLSGAVEPSQTVLLTNSYFSGRAELFRTILFDLGLPHENRDESELRLAFVAACLDRFAGGGRTLILIDEAQNLSAELLEEIRMWGNLEGPHGRAIQVVLCALPELGEKLRGERMTAFRQRVAVRARLEPLSVEESKGLLHQQLREAGVNPERSLAREAADLLARRAGGVPRVLNQLAHRAFRLAAQAAARQVDAEAVIEAADLMGLAPPPEDALDVPRVLSLPTEPAEKPDDGPTGVRGKRTSTKKAAGRGE